MNDSIARILRLYSRDRWRRRSGIIGFILLIISLLAGNVGDLTLSVRMAAKLGVVAGVVALMLSEAMYHISKAVILSIEKDIREGRPIFWALSGVAAFGLGLWCLGWFGTPLLRDVLSSSKERYQTAEGTVRKQDRRLVWLEFIGDDRTFLLLLGPYVRTGERYRIIYLKHSSVVLAVYPIAAENVKR